MSLPSTATAEQLNQWLEGMDEAEKIRSDLNFLAMAYLGHCRHPYCSPDWIAHNSMGCTIRNRLMGMLGEASERRLYQRMKESFEALGAVPNASL